MKVVLATSSVHLRSHLASEPNTAGMLAYLHPPGSVAYCVQTGEGLPSEGVTILQVIGLRGAGGTAAERSRKARFRWDQFTVLLCRLR